MDKLDMTLVAFAVALGWLVGCWTVVKGVRGLLTRRITTGGVGRRELVGGFAIVMSIVIIIVGLLFLAMMRQGTILLLRRTW